MKVFGDDPRWLFSRRLDLFAFGFPALLSLVLLGIGAQTGALTKDAPDWVFLACIIMVDVAHVWSTVFRVYLDGEELKRRPLLYWGAPLVVYILGASAYAVSAATFWRILAYIAVFHFVKQQYGWVALYRRRTGGDDVIDRVLDRVVIYTATLFPLAWWHAHPGRAFHWFMGGDFVALEAGRALTDALVPLYWAVLAVYLARQVFLHTRGRDVSFGKSLVVLTTWFMWWLGIMALNSDFAFTVTNVLIHGVPYLVLVFLTARARAAHAETLASRALRFGVVGFVLICVGAAFLEEALWDQLVWQSRPWLRAVFAWLSAEETPAAWIVPLLSLPQAVHYALDGFIWKPSKDAKLAQALFG